MTSERFQKIEQLCHSALEREENQRAAFLEHACAGDDALRSDVESLLAHHSTGERFEPSPVLEAAKIRSMPGTKLGPYEIIEPIGKGGMGEVWKARDTRLDRVVAIKLSKTEFSERFEREARAVAALNHPHICQLYDVGPNYLVFEYVEGEPLKGPLPLDKTLEYAAQICDALDAAHTKKITHRDLKPANILVNKQCVKLLDFGLAKIEEPVEMAEQAVTTGLTVKGQIMGTLRYMSPEQLQGKKADARSDIFSFGCVLYEMITGKHAFDGASPASVIGAILERPAPSIADVAPLALDRVLRRCLEKYPDRRWQSASDVKWTLENLENADAASQSDTRAVRSWTRWTVSAILALVSVGIVGWALWPKPAPETRSVRFVLDPPPGNSFVHPFFAQSFSPDGRFFVFSGGTPRSGGSLWLRPLDSFEARQLPGTEGGNGTFWSPDGRSIGFVAENKLKRIEIPGGSPQILCDVGSNYEGGSWSRNGVILFSDGGVIRRVPATGGAATAVTALDPARIEIGHFFPQFLSDGRAFLYLIQSPNAKVQGIYAAVLDGASGRAISPARIIAGADSKAVYAPPFAGSQGYLLWQRQDTLMAQRFDPSRLRVEGDPISVAHPVDSLTFYPDLRRAAFWTSDTGFLAYLTGSGHGFRMNWVSRDGKQREAIGPEDDYEWPRLSPDGRRLAVARSVSTNQEIWVYEFSRNVMARLTFSGKNTLPVWSSDGRQITFSSVRNGSGQISRKDIGGAGREERLAQGAKVTLDWSRDGRYLLYEEQNAKTGWDLIVLPLDGPEGAQRDPIPFLQTPFDEQDGVFSPDGKWIAYDSNESGETEVYIQPFPPSGGKWQVSSGGGSNPRWRGDGKELFYRIDPLGDVMAAGIHTSPGRVDIDPPHVLFMWNGPPTFDVSSDGQHFLMLDPPGANTGIVRLLTLVSNWQAALKK